MSTILYECQVCNNRYLTTICQTLARSSSRMARSGRCAARRVASCMLRMTYSTISNSAEHIYRPYPSPFPPCRARSLPALSHVILNCVTQHVITAMSVASPPNRSSPVSRLSIISPIQFIACPHIISTRHHLTYPTHHHSTPPSHLPPPCLPCVISSPPRPPESSPSASCLPTNHLPALPITPCFAISNLSHPPFIMSYELVLYSLIVYIVLRK
jgi:hypothetical protein